VDPAPSVQEARLERLSVHRETSRQLELTMLHGTALCATNAYRSSHSHLQGATETAYHKWQRFQCRGNARTHLHCVHRHVETSELPVSCGTTPVAKRERTSGTDDSHAAAARCAHSFFRRPLCLADQLKIHIFAISEGIAKMFERLKQRGANDTLRMLFPPNSRERQRSSNVLRFHWSQRRMRAARGGPLLQYELSLRAPAALHAP
jgi:hypothetical protein